MQASSAPLKWLYPWASQSTTIYELPPTTTNPGLASQTLGFPPQTMQPPESGGTPPQGPDFNAGMYQVARIAWWLMYGGPFVYDSTFATNAAISGYAQGGWIASSDYRGFWLNTSDNNQINPDTTGTGWVPGYAYGSTSLALTNANITLTPLQAAKKILLLTGTLTGNIVLTVPAWIYNWEVVNQTSGAFTVTVTTAGGSGSLAVQGATSTLRGDGTNINIDVRATATPPQFDFTTKVATTAFVGRAAGNMQTVTQISGNTTLTAANAGQLIWLIGTVAYTVTLPALSSVAVGAKFTFHASGSTASTATLAAAGADLIIPGNSGTGIATLPFGVGDDAEITSYGTSWVLSGGSVALRYNLGTFRSQSGNPGFRRFADGGMEQWGTVSVGSGGTLAITFPLAFANATIFPVVTPANSGACYATYFAGSATGMTIATFSSTGAAIASTVTWRVLGTSSV